MRTSNPSAQALTAMATAVLTTFVIGSLYVARELLIPIALAILISFLLTPLVTRLERRIGRMAAVLLIVALTCGATVIGGYYFTRQLIELATKLPDYKDNMQRKLRSLQMPGGGRFTKLSQTFEDLKKDIPGLAEPVTVPAKSGPTLNPPIPTANLPTPLPVEIVEKKSGGPAAQVSAIIGPMVGPLGTAALVLLLVIFMLLQREDLRGRLIRLVGQGHISATTRAMDDAAGRVSSYLLMQLVVNVTYGIALAIGLYFIGVPNALLWGVFATVLRFIPYIGPWLAATFPVVLSLAVSTNWTMPILTLGLFAFIELVSNNVMEPWLYGSSTGVSSVALILAAVFWTWLWGTAGLVLATPMTVCLVVMGRHVPKLAFLSVLLSDEAALAPSEECYHRLLTPDTNDSIQFADAYLKTNTILGLYDKVFIPVIAMLERDGLTGELDERQRASAQGELRDLIDELGTRPAPAVAPLVASAEGAAARPPATCRVLIIPARAAHDEVAGQMLSQLLTAQGYAVDLVPAKLTSGEALAQLETYEVDAVCISVVHPSTVAHARYLATKMRARSPRLHLMIGLWNYADDAAEASTRLRSANVSEVVFSLEEALAQLNKLSSQLAQEAFVQVPDIGLEEQRLAALQNLGLLDTPAEPIFDQITRKLTRIFEVPIALISLVDHDREFFKSQVGLPDDLAASREVPRQHSVCTYVAVKNDALVVEDLARNPRFANNPFLRERGLRFYAGCPLRVPSGPAIGSLCILDVKPRTFSERERRLLQVMADEVMEIIADRARAAEPSPSS